MFGVIVAGIGLSGSHSGVVTLGWIYPPGSTARRSDLLTAAVQRQRTEDRHLLRRLFDGGEAGLTPLDECSVVTAPYEVDGMIVGTAGVIGPTRMAYERVIPIVDITAKLLSSALTQR